MKDDNRSGNSCADQTTTLTPILISVDEAAVFLGLGRTYTWGLVRRGDLPRKNFGRRTLVLWSDVKQLAERGLGDQ